MSDKRDDEQKFSPKQNIEDGMSEDEKYLNKGVANAPEALSYSVTVVLIAVGFIIGAALIGGFVTGMLCLVQTVTALMSDPTAIGDVDNIQSYAIGEVQTCASGMIFTPIPLLSTIVGGIMGAYPAYKIAQFIKSSTYLKSVV